MIGFGLLIARLCLAIVFLYSAVDKLWYWQSSIAEVKGDGLPWPVAFAGATVFTRLVGGCLVATGFFAWLGALVLAGFTVASHFARALLLALPRSGVPARADDHPRACGHCRRTAPASPPRFPDQRMIDRKMCDRSSGASAARCCCAFCLRRALDLSRTSTHACGAGHSAACLTSSPSARATPAP